jgi:tetratricopeptide (TPR) repeat protein
LMGLSQALLGNYRMAVAAYRKAVKLAPRNPWYHHNLGHLLDVGLSESVAALDHLRIAQRIQPDEDEISASLAHCLARLGQLDEARKMAKLAVRRAPRNREHQTLLEWIENGAPSDVTPTGRAERRPSRSGVEPHSGPAPDQVLELLAENSGEHQNGAAAKGGAAGKDDARNADNRMRQARSLWTDFCARRAPRVTKPAVYAAAIEYTLSKLEGGVPLTQAELARRYNVGPRSIAARHDEIWSALGLEPGDTRYSRTAR